MNLWCDGRVPALRPVFLFLCVVLASCAAESAQATEQPEDSTATVPTSSAAVTTPSDDSTTTTTTDSATTTESTLETTTVAPTSTAPTPQCTVITDFELSSSNARWSVVNDNVMGGRSLGDRTFVGTTMVFSGSVNTDGGGFSSLRFDLRMGLLGDADRLVFRVRSDGRRYLATFEDSLEGRDRRVAFRAPIVSEQPNEWETITVMFADLDAEVFGQLIPAAPFRNDLASRIGIRLSDGIDGDFILEIDSIEACSPN